MTKKRTRVGIVATGVANVASVTAAVRRTGGIPFLVRGPADVESADRLILPGVGAFGRAMKQLGETNLSEALRDRIARDRPTLAICLGLQVLAQSSEESPGIAGLGVIHARVQRLRAARVPHFGWNRVSVPSQSRYLESGFAYFAHSYAIVSSPAEWTASWTDCGEPILAALERGNVLACQFHPELSGSWGQCLIRQWLLGATIECAVRRPQC